MKIIAIIVTLIGLLITGVSSLGVVYSVRVIINSITNSANSGIGTMAEAISNAQILSFVNLLGVVVTFFGVVLMIAAMFWGRKKQQQIAV